MIVVTGAAGFIGSAFVELLNRQGIRDILVVDDLGTSTKWRNLIRKRIRSYLHKDRFLEALTSGAVREKIDAIVHLGACTSTTEQNAEYLLQNNFNYTKTLARWAVENDVRFVYASSAATYGDGSNGFSDDTAEINKLEPLNCYGLSKHLFDQWTLDNKLESKIAGLKFFNVYGPNEYHKGDMASVVFKAYHQVMDRGSVDLFRSYDSKYADGEQLRDFIYVGDCVEVIFWLLKNPKVGGIYNLGTGKARSWNDLVRAVFAALGRTPAIQYVEMPEILRPKYQYFTEATMQKLRSAGYAAPFASLEDGVAEYVNGYLSRGLKIL
jgi:ADP-L-glycero-D-manno-heptose 6-epimerase